MSQEETSKEINMFTFGDIEQINIHDFADYLYCSENGDYYEPPISFKELAKTLHAQTHHESALEVKINIISTLFKENKYLDFDQFSAFIKDFLIFGNGFLSPQYNKAGGIFKLNHMMAKFIRVGKTNNFYFLNCMDKTEIKDLIHLKEYDINQNIYGMPKYISAMLSAWLNQSATLFRMKYYKNGSHAGFILSITGEISNNSLDNIKKQLQEAKGVGNFKNMVVHQPKGDKESMRLIPISEVTAKDEFLNIKNVTRDDILAVHRVPLVLMSIPPINTGGHGNPNDHAMVFSRNEILPIVKKLEALNIRLGVPVFKFDSYSLG